MSPYSTLTPVDNGAASTQTDASTKRVQVIDALRGCALFGIILTHVCLLYMNLHLKVGNSAIVENPIYKIVYQVFIGKASTIFSFLFGLSFAIQVQSAKSKGKPFAKLFTWRLITLFFIGYLNSLLFSGDILQTYAIMGLVLIASSRLGNRAILATSIVLYVLGITTRYFSQDLLALFAPYIVYASESVWLSSLDLQRVEFFLISGRIFTIPSLFLLGLFAGRKDLFSNALKELPLRRGMLKWGGISFLVSTCAYYFVKEIWVLQERSFFAINALKHVTQSFFYLALMLHLYQFTWPKKILGWLVPVGQMGLSTYLMQSVLLFQLNSFREVIDFESAFWIAVLFFTGQSLFAYWWMARYKFGPVEWLWRTLIHFKKQPLKRQHPSYSW